MGEKVDHVEILSAEGFGLKKDVYWALREEYENGNIPESSFLGSRSRTHCFKEVGEDFEALRLWWQGEGSAHAMPLLITKILPQFEGKADIVFTYESGDLEGYRLDNHKVTQHHVKVALGDPVTP